MIERQLEAAIGIVSGVLLVLVLGRSLILHRRLIAYLRSRYNVLWLDLGAPTLFKAIVQKTNPTAQPINYQTWLYFRAYQTLNDQKVSTIAANLRRDLLLTFALFIAAGAMLFMYART